MVRGENAQDDARSRSLCLADTALFLFHIAEVQK